jgi:glutamyl-tRNA synthetase
MLYQAFGWQPPFFAHLPMILGPDKSKLSKRHGATTIIEYREKGYLAEAVVNFLALLGWSLDDKTELFTRAELVSSFTLERVGKTAAVFDIPKLDWMNGTYIRTLDAEEFAQRSLPFLERDLPEEVGRPLDYAYVRKVTPLVQERTRILSELGELCSFFFSDDLSYPSSLLVGKGLDAAVTRTILERVLTAIEGVDQWDVEHLEGSIRPLGDEPGLSTKVVFGVVRVAITGRVAAPPLFQTMEVLGLERCLKRLRAAVTLLESPLHEQAN